MNQKKDTVPSPTTGRKPAARSKAPNYKTTIDNHRKASAHHAEAAKHHLDAAKFYAEGNSEKAAHSAMLAWGHHAIAGEFINDDAKHHAQNLKRTNYR